MHPFAVGSVVERLRAVGGGYEVVHESPGLELGVYVLVAPEPDRQQPHEDDEVYVVLDGTGVLEVDGASVDVKVGDAVFVEAGAEHRFTAYEQLAVLVIFERAGGPGAGSRARVSVAEAGRSGAGVAPTPRRVTPPHAC